MGLTFNNRIIINPIFLNKRIKLLLSKRIQETALGSSKSTQIPNQIIRIKIINIRTSIIPPINNKIRCLETSKEDKAQTPINFEVTWFKDNNRTLKIKDNTNFLKMFFKLETTAEE